ncbi:MAG: succinic semialdehyde dehydrogenase [Actinomycetaceae bacterium]|nr:succinic semialdehyde dehydrogenase [Actinomycetaceae bacterium]
MSLGTTDTTQPPSEISQGKSGQNRASLIHMRIKRALDVLVPEAVHWDDTGAGADARISPISVRPLPKVPNASPKDLSKASERARRAQKTWAATHPLARARILLRFHDAVLRNRDYLLDIIQAESGKARVHAFEEISDVVLTARYYARVSARALAPKARRGAIPLATRVEVNRNPKGVVGIISPWNYPLTLAVSDAIPALMAGNAVVLKPDSLTPLSAFAIKDVLVQAGLDPELFQIVPGPGRELGPALIETSDYVMFTGSSATGATIAQQCAARLIDFSAELGGKNPMIVLPDADIDAAARGATIACFSNAGQLCVSIERIYVHRHIYDQFVARFLAHTRDMRVEASLDWDTDMGVLVSPEHLDKVHAHVRDALGKGARALAGGTPLPDIAPNAYAPTILENVTPDMDVYAQETFGPVVALYPVDSEAQAIGLANSTQYGLNASVWSTPARGRELARHLRAGTVNVNEGYAATWASMDAPMGGMGISGVGRRHGIEGLLKYTEAQTIATQSSLVPLSTPPGMGAQQWAQFMADFFTVARHIPFMK